MKTIPACGCQTTARAKRGDFHGILPGLALIFMPKCPACLATYLAAFTGFSVSVNTAEGLRCALIILCAGWLSAVAIVVARRFTHRAALIKQA